MDPTKVHPADIINMVRRARGDPPSGAPHDRYSGPVPAPLEAEGIPVERPEVQSFDVGSGRGQWRGRSIVLSPSELTILHDLLNRAIVSRMEEELESMRATLQPLQPRKRSRGAVPKPRSPQPQAVPTTPVTATENDPQR